MKFAGTVDIAAPRDRVWAFVTDPRQVAACGPGVEHVEVIDDRHFRATAKVGVGFIAVRLVVDMELAELDEPNRALLRAHGRAAGGAVDATATMRLADDGSGGTTMDWTADVALTGALASLGNRMLEGPADSMIGQTFDCVRARLEA